MKITLLGTGTSVGIPSLGQLGWGKCNHKIQRINDKDVQF